MDAPTIEPGWYPDPANHAVERYWDGSVWTPATRPNPGAEGAASQQVVAEPVEENLEVPPFRADFLTEDNIGIPLESTLGIDPRPYTRLAAYRDGSVQVIQNRKVQMFVPASSVLTLGLEYRTVMVRRTPTWAIVAGVLGLLVFLLGIAFFFVKETVPEKRTFTVLELKDGRSIAIDTLLDDEQWEQAQEDTVP